MFWIAAVMSDSERSPRVAALVAVITPTPVAVLERSWPPMVTAADVLPSWVVPTDSVLVPNRLTPLNVPEVIEVSCDWSCVNSES